MLLKKLENIGKIGKNRVTMKIWAFLNLTNPTFAEFVVGDFIITTNSSTILNKFTSVNMKNG
jgi:hypothetical protein